MLAYQRGDAAALSVLFDRHSAPLRRMLLRDVSPSEADDLLQQAFLQFHRARYDFRRGAKVRPWLWTIAVNVKRMHLRSQRRRPFADNNVDPANDPPGPATDYDAPLQAARLRAALQQLPPVQRDTVVLHWLEGLSFSEVAAVIGGSEGAAKVRAHRAYGQLRRILQDPPVTATATAAYPKGPLERRRS